MKLTVCFGDVRVVVPCGDGDFTVGELIQRAVGRYKKAAGKQKDTDVRVIVLKSLRDGGILDIDDLLSDVVDDRDQVSAEFVELPERLKYDDSVVAYGTVVLRSKEAIQSYGANERPAATRLVGSRRDGSQDAAADDEASSSGPSSGEQDDQDELPVAAVVVTKSDLDKDIGNKQSQLTVRRESEPCKTAVSTAVSQRQPTITDTGNIGQPRPPAPSSQVPRPTKERPSSERYKAPVQLSLSTGEPADDDDDEQTDDDGQGSLPRLQQQPTGGTVEVATGCPAADADKPPAPAATTISRLLSGFARSSARQSLGSSSASRAWTVAQERAETRSAARPESSTAVSAAAASEATASAALQQMPWLTSASARRVPTSLALAPLSAEVGDDDGCPRPATEAAARHLVGAASPEQPKAPLKAAARRLLSSPRKSNDCDNGGRKGGVAGESASDDTVLGRSESDTTKETSKPPSQPGCAVTVKIQGAREHLGFHVAGYFRSGREAGLAIHHLEAGGRMEREGLIAIGDIVQEVNGKSLIGVPLDKAKAMLREALDAGDAVLSIMKYKMTEAGSSSSSLGPMGPCNVKATDSLPASASTGAIAVNLKHPPQPPMRSPSTRLSSAALQNATATEWAIDPPRLIGFDELTVDLVKGAEGLGFTISSREHLAAFNGGVAPVFVKTIMPFGAAIADGRLKCGDRLMHVNGDDVSCRTQDDIVVLLRSTKQGSTVRIRVLRQHAMLDAPPLRTPSSAAGSPGSPADPTYENVLVKVGDPSFDYGDIMTFDIPSAGIMPGTLGISIKGETALLAEGIRDLGVFIKDIVAGGAAHLDGRLRPGDLLLSVNGTKLQGLSNAAAMAVLRRAANECRTACSVTVARRQQPMGVESEQKQRPQSIQLLQANRVGDKGVSAALQMEVPEPKASRQLELRLPSQAAADRLSSPLPVTDRVTAHVSAASDAGATTYDKEPHVELVHEEQVAAAPNGREKAFVQRRALSVESLDSHGSGSVSQQSRSKFSSLESLKAEMRDPYELSGEPQKARRRVARGCNESFRAAVDHSYDAPEAFFRHVGAQGSKFDEVHDSGINPLSSSSSSSDQFLEVGDRKQPAVALAAKESSTKGTKKDKTKASAFFGHLFRIGKSRKSIEDRQKGPFVKRPGGGSGSGRQDELVDGPAEWKTERARVGSSTSQVQLRLQRNQQHQGSWSYHGSSVQGGTAVVAPSAMNEYYHRLMEDQRLQMVLASAISNDPINQAADHVYVNWTIPSSYGSNKKPHALPQQGTAGAVSPSAMAPAELGYSKVKAKQKSEPDLAKHRVVPPPAVPLHRDNLWSDRIYHRSERDLPESIRATSTASDWRSHQQPMGVVSSGHRHKKAGPTATGPVSARRPLSLHDDTDALLMAAHRRAAAANDYDNLPAVNFAAAATQTHPKLAAEPTAHRRLTTATARAAPSRTSDGRRAGGGGGAPPASGRSVGSSARPTNRLSWCYDYSGSSSSDDYSYGKAAGNAYTSAPQGARKQAEAARV